ncbi:MAG TPA: hypothetical protein VGX27_14040 [Candidatus Dormibacteraeota bacterium]|nr:hypothetical protein [Candidatus Dormibacteraeota bacterium]
MEVPGQGLLVSTNGGRTWHLTAITAFAGKFFYSIVVDPTDGRRIFTATDQGVLASTNGGSSWRNVRPGTTWDISLDAASSEVLVAAEDGVYVSSDRGRTWTRIRLPGAPNKFAGQNVIARVAVAHAPSSGDIAYVFAAYQTSVWLWRRDAKGGAFSEIQLPSLDPPGPGDPGYGISQSWYDWCLAVHPQNPEVVYLGAVDAFRGRRSPSGTWSWSDISSQSSGGSVHPDQHAFLFDPSDPDTLYCCNDGGLFRSKDAGDNWESLNKGLGITEFEYIAQNPRSRAWVIGGTQDNGTLRNNRAGVWDQVALGDGGDCDVDESSPNTCYHSFYGMSVERSRDGGDKWRDITPNVSDTYRALFYPPLEVNGRTVARAGESVFVSDDEGDHWAEVAIPSGGLASAMEFTAAGQLLVGRTDGRMFRVARRASGWGSLEELSVPRRNGYVSGLLALTGAPDTYWATISAMGGGHVFRSTDAGRQWEDMTHNLPDIPTHTVVNHPRNPNRFWLATDRGVYETTNGGRSWSLFGVGLPRALAVDLGFHARFRLLRVGTRSRGVWETEVR